MCAENEDQDEDTRRMFYENMEHEELVDEILTLEDAIAAEHSSEPGYEHLTKHELIRRSKIDEIIRIKWRVLAMRLVLNHFEDPAQAIIWACFHEAIGDVPDRAKITAELEELTKLLEQLDPDKPADDYKPLRSILIK